MSTEIVKKEVFAPVEYTEDQIDIVKKYLAPGCPEMELKFLMEQSKQQGMSVIKKDCHLVPAQQWDFKTNEFITKWSIQTSIDFYREKGMNSFPGLIVSVDCRPYFLYRETEDSPPAEKEWHNIPAMQYPAYPDLARCKIKRKDMDDPFEVIVYWIEYAKKNKKGIYQAMWAKMPGIMLCKVAEAGCWRRAIPGLFTGVYTMDEMPGDNEAIKLKAPKAEPQKIEAPPEKEQPEFIKGLEEDKAKDLKKATKKDFKNLIKDMKKCNNQYDLKACDENYDTSKFSEKEYQEVNKVLIERLYTIDIANKTSSKEPEKEKEKTLEQSFILELEQLENVDQMQKFVATRTEDLNTLQPDEFKNVHKTLMKMTKKFQKLHNEKKEPQVVEAPALVDQVADEVRKDLGKPPLKEDEKEAPKSMKYLPDSLFRKVTEILETMTDENTEKPYITDGEECRKAMRYMFEVEDVRKIPYSSGMRFVQKFNKHKNAEELFKLFIEFKNY